MEIMSSSLDNNIDLIIKQANHLITVISDEIITSTLSFHGNDKNEIYRKERLFNLMLKCNNLIISSKQMLDNK
ncbi:putative ORFan [Cotonvirus japonicus]|uniref:ORFan n=1 Tax=Cotonvirus japonicus TaxID=2811091 RepID=A0ABM7NRR2_9VIRU|nr:putative ORFan [Cotonvirus japonicus]BCS82841.1 putative ORFan [Cotonvirus japonicus]